VHVRVDETRCDQLSCRIDRPVNVAAVTLQAVTRVASALDHPTRPARLLVGFAAAGPTDIAAR
jgi:tripartite-type tricarboxylate transporter receptor subunit TctC